ncbi:helix-turn-helix transcriptional regulator [Nonomuraea typhae]|uniref:helix-turn-helix transcriptional regulator n=1 Tax=Nonomuraea typhae TaxID=2603600 RepID=UPI001C685A5D|nr:YafY family protein [Nonomuraea typhae]
MANTSGRMLRLLSLLQTHRHWPGTDLADRLGVSERTLRRDVDRLRALGYPVDAGRGVHGGYRLRSGTAMPPLLLDDDEAVAIAVGLQAAADGVVTGIEESSVQALAKVVQVMPPRLRRRVDALTRYTVRPYSSSGPGADPATLITLAQACRDHERLRFAYPPPDGALRRVEPHRLVSVRRTWYLLAWDLDRHDWRTFRVDRMREPARDGTPFRPREVPGGDPAAFVRDRFAALPTRWEIVLVVHAPLDHVERVLAHTGGRAVPLGEGICRLELHVDAFDWPVLILTALAADFEVVTPPEFGAYLAETADRLGRGALSRSGGR